MVAAFSSCCMFKRNSNGMDALQTGFLAGPWRSLYYRMREVCDCATERDICIKVKSRTRLAAKDGLDVHVALVRLPDSAPTAFFGVEVAEAAPGATRDSFNPPAAEKLHVSPSILKACPRLGR